MCYGKQKKKKNMLAVTTEFVFLSFRHTCTLTYLHETRIYMRVRGTHTHTYIRKYISVRSIFLSPIRIRIQKKTIHADNVIHVHKYRRIPIPSSSVYIVFIEYRFCRKTRFRKLFSIDFERKSESVL